MIAQPPPAATKLEIKLAKWRYFTLSIVGILIFIDCLSALIGPTGETNLYFAIFGGGGLFTASIGLTAAAAGDMLFDHIVPAAPPLGHVKWLLLCLALSAIAIALYILAKENLDLSGALEFDAGRKSLQASPDEIAKRFTTLEATKMWVSIVSPIYCVMSAAVSFQTVKRSEP
ncbi:hypothetical protein [Nonomuraea typhae]|uniref:hypothetical protein n=1 Tax=Nonomuraea typhae TaxID=2603600 RepID=UPI0012F8663B|nr:hypothetical protein [Nonomuraea typhae]